MSNEPTETLTDIQITIEDSWIYEGNICTQMEAAVGTFGIPEIPHTVRFKLKGSVRHARAEDNGSPRPTLYTTPKIKIPQKRRNEISRAIVREIYRSHDL